MDRATGAVVLAVVALTAHCAAPAPAEFRAVDYGIEAVLDPESHTLEARVVLELVRIDPGRPLPDPVTIELALHPDLTIKELNATGATVADVRRRRGDSDRFAPDGHEIVPTIHSVSLDGPTDSIELTLDYRGKLFQDAGAGETADRSHNFSVFAHIGPDGVFLDPLGHWYPRVHLPIEAAPALRLADFHLAVERIRGFELVAALENDDDDEKADRWKSAFPTEGAALMGGPLLRWSSQYGDVGLHAVIAPYKAKVAGEILIALSEYLDRYEPLIGPYPYKEFTVYEAFFTSAFGFPGCAAIGGDQLSEFKQYRRHGYLDHQLLNSWFCDGVFDDRKDGVWCQGLVSYLSNYYGFVLDGDEAGARKHRRNISNFMSHLRPETDLALESVTLRDVIGRALSNQKGSAIYHMLQRRIGRDAMFAALRRFGEQNTGRFATLRDLQDHVEQETGENLSAFFDQWFRGVGSPQLDLIGAERIPGDDAVTVTISQGAANFSVDVPLRLHFGDEFEDLTVRIDEPQATVAVPLTRDGLTAVELDPDYHVFRKLKDEETMPTTLMTRRPPTLLIVLPDGELPDGYRTVANIFTSDVLGTGAEPRPGRSVIERAASEFSEAEAADSAVFILGEAVREPTVSEFLARTRSPVRWIDSGFGVGDEDYTDPRKAVLLTVHHPDRPEYGVTVYYGNSESALANADVLTYYSNSLLVYDSPVDGLSQGTLPDGMPHTRVIHREDFEFHDRIEVD